MRSNTQALALMKQANKSEAARVIFVGDTKQLDGVAAGTPIDLLQTSGMPTAVMSDIVRQRSEQLKSAVSASITGSIQQAFERLGNSVKSGRPEYVQAAADLYLNRLVSERTKTGILTLSNKAHQEINLAVRAGLQAEGQIGSENVVISSPKPLRSSKTEAMSIDSYQPGDVALVHQNVASAGIKRDEAYQIAEIVGKAIQLQNMETGNRLEINLETNRKLVGTYCVYETEKRKFSKSEQVKFRITDTESGIKNGITGTITNISDKSVTVKISDGSTATLAAESIPARGMDHTHALTGHDYQGATVDKIIIAISANYSNVMWGRNTAYVLRGAVNGFRYVR